MITKPILCFIGARHGETRYTGTFPDLTEEGVKQSQDAARAISRWIQAYGISPAGISIVSSPAPRARGTAEVIKEMLTLTGDVVIDPALSPMAWRDPERCRVALGGFSGRGYIDYETEPVFADPTLFETPSEMRTRSFARLADRIRVAMRGEGASYEIAVSHYEVWCHLMAELFGIVASESEAYRLGETMELAVFPATDDRVMILGVCRGEQHSMLFDLRELIFLPTT